MCQASEKQVKGGMKKNTGPRKWPKKEDNKPVATTVPREISGKKRAR